MRLGDSATEQRFPFAYDRVFDGLVAVLPTIGFSVKTQDRVIGRITIIAGLSAYLQHGESPQAAAAAATTAAAQASGGLPVGLLLFVGLLIVLVIIAVSS